MWRWDAGGVDVGYAIPNRALGALVKADIPPAILLTDSDNAYGSITQGFVIEGVVKSRPELVGIWATCYGGTEAPWAILDGGSRIEVTSLLQGIGLSPDFFALGVRSWI